MKGIACDYVCKTVGLQWVFPKDPDVRCVLDSADKQR